MEEFDAAMFERLLGKRMQEEIDMIVANAMPDIERQIKQKLAEIAISVVKNASVSGYGNELTIRLRL